MMCDECDESAIWFVHAKPLDWDGVGEEPVDENYLCDKHTAQIEAEGDLISKRAIKGSRCMMDKNLAPNILSVKTRLLRIAKEVRETAQGSSRIAMYEALASEIEDEAAKLATALETFKS